MSKPPDRGISLARKLIFSLVVAAIALGGAELGLRLWLGPPPPPVRVFGALGEHDHYFEVQDGIARTLYLPSGDPTTSAIPVRWDGPRVAVLGASSVHLGSGLLQEYEFPALLEAQLGVKVLNLGSPGLDSFDLAAIAEEIHTWDLSALVVYEGHNDLGNTYFQQRYGDAGAARRIRTRAALEQLQLFAQLTRLVQPIEGTARQTLNPSEQIFPNLTPAQRQQARDYFKANLRRITWLAHSQGMAVVLVTPVSRLDQAPLFGTCEDGRCADELYAQGTELATTDPTRAARLLEEARDLDGLCMRANSDMTQAVREVAAEERTWLVDAAADLPRDHRMPIAASWLFSDVLHFSADGHQAMAQIIAPALREALAQTQGR